MNKINSVSGYVKSQKKKRRKIILIQIAIFLGFIALWEVLASLNIINSFLISKPSEIFSLFMRYLKSGELFKHLSISLLETLIGLIVGTVLGIIIAIGLWWSPTASKIADPFLVVLNALPKTALAPIMIIWAGTGIKGIVVVAVSISLIVTVLSSYSYFMSVDEETIKMMKTFGANKLQILFKLILPANFVNLISVIKINIGMSWVGVIVGEFMVSRFGIGYLVVYGSQVFQMDLVMMGVIVLAILAFVMYAFINFIENYYRKKR